MATNRDRSVACLIAACALFAVCPPALAGADASARPAEAGLAVDASRVIDRISELIVSDKLVRAQALINELVSGEASVGLSDDESRRVFELLGDVTRRIRRADPLEISLQRAELSLVGDDLVSSMRQAEAVRSSSTASEAQRTRAEMLVSLIDQKREALRATIPSRIDRAAAAFANGDYAAAKADLVLVERSGVALTDEQSRIVSTRLARIRSIENDRGGAFGGGVALLSMMEPGIADKTDWNTRKAAPAPAPAPAAQQQTTPAAPAAAAPQEPAEDMITKARRLEAQSLLAEADKAWSEANYAEAQRLYSQAVEQGKGFLSDEQIAQAQSRMTESAVILRGNLPSGAPLDDNINIRSVARQQTEAEFSNAIEQAKQAMKTGDMGKARDLASTAKLTLNQGRDLFDSATYESMLAQADDLLAAINDAEERQRILKNEQIQKDAAAKAARDRASKAREVDQKIAELIESVRAHQAEQNYEKALQEVDRILFLDPQNPAGRLLRDVLSDMLILRDYQNISDQRRPSYAHQLLDNWEATVAPRDIMNFPLDWKNISQRRGDPMQFSESASNRAVLAKLEDKRIRADFTDNTLDDVLTFIANVGNVEMDVDWPSLEDLGISRDSPVSLRLTNVPIETVLNRVLEKVSDSGDAAAGWAVTDGVLTVASDEVLRRNTVLEIYDIRDLLIEVPDYDNAPQFDLNTVFQVGGQTGGGGGGGQSPFQDQGTDIQRPDPQEKIDQLRDIIQQNVDPDGWVDAGGETGTITELNGNFIIVNTPKNHRAITGLLSKLRAVRNLQINVESRFLLVNEDYFEQIGVDLDVYFANNNEYNILRTIDPTLLPQDFFGRTEEGNFQFNRIVQGAPLFDTNGDGVIDNTDTPVGQPVFAPGTQGDQFSPIQSAQNSFGLTQGLAQGSFASDVFKLINDTTGGPALSLAGRFLDDVQVDFLVEATQADRSSMTLTAPRLTITNGQLAYTFVGTQTSFVSDLVPVVSNSAVGLDPTIGVVPEGVRLVVRGVVSADRRYVTLDVTTDVATATLNASQTVQAAAGGTGNIPGNGLASGTIQLPVVTITRVQTTVTVPDQGTVLLGGQRMVNEYTTETGVPVLSKIPVLNRFFTNRVDSKEEQTLLVLIKPTVLIQNEEEEKHFPGLLDALGQ